jgi:hypothetical protein
MTKYVVQHQSSLATSWSHHLRWFPARYHLKRWVWGCTCLFVNWEGGRGERGSRGRLTSPFFCCFPSGLLHSAQLIIMICVSDHLCYSGLWIMLFWKLRANSLYNDIGIKFTSSSRYFNRFCLCISRDSSTELCVRSLRKIRSSN